MKVVGISGKADHVDRLNRDPPVKWDETTAWGFTERDGELVLQEFAVIDCPDCGEEACWAKGTVACNRCDTRQQLIG